jgi:hypothetical protein
MRTATKLKTNAFIVAAAIGFLLTKPSQTLAAEYGLRNDNTGCIADLRRARKNKGWLAIAVTRSVGIAQGCGIASQASRRSTAIEGALKGCKTNVKYEIFAGNTGCRVMGVEKRK